MKALMVAFAVMAMGVVARAEGCAATVDAAVQQIAIQRGGPSGYRVVMVRNDALRGRAWAMVEQCGRPEAPLIAVAIGHAAVVRAAVVHVGDEVTVLARSGSSHMELHGWAEESGAVAAKVRVRLPRMSEDDDATVAKIVCVVTRAGQVEVVQ